ELIDYMKDHRYLLFSLFDHDHLWVWKSDHYAIDSNYRFANLVNELDSSAEEKKKELLKLSELTPNQKDNLKECQLDKGSIIWKIKIEGLDNMKFKTPNNDTINFIDEIYTIYSKAKENNDEIRKTSYITTFKNYIKKVELEADEALIKGFIERLIIIDEESKEERDCKEKNIKLNINEWLTKHEEETIKLDINKRLTIFEEEIFKLDLKSDEALPKDLKERVEKEVHKNWKRKIAKLMKDFTIRITKFKNLAKDSDNFQINIDIVENKLQCKKDLIRLFGADKFLSNAKDQKDKYVDIGILALNSLNNDIIILTEIGIFIFHFDVKNLIFLNYYHIHLYESDLFIENIRKTPGYPKVDDKDRTSDYDELIYGWMAYIQKDNETFLKYRRALFNYTTEKHDTELLDEIYNNFKEDKEFFLKNGSELLMSAIRIQASSLIDKIYNVCLDLFIKDLKNNKAYLSIINESMPLLDNYYPEYITRYSSDTNMIIDSPEYKIEQLSTSHLNPFSNIGIVNLSPSIAWTKYTSLFHIINEFYVDGFSKSFYRCYNYLNDRIFPEKLMPTITFIIPYIQFVCYPSDYNRWWGIIKPKPSPFVETINREIYKSWNGEALINFKWNSYGRYYYSIIWIFFAAFLACFTAASTYSKRIDEGTKNRLLIATIVLGSIHLNFEIRQVLYDPFRWVLDPWNWFDFGAYLVPTIASIIWLSSSDDNKPYFLLSISCLLLDCKFLLFFRAFEAFGVYFVIIISVAKKIGYFLIILFIILLSFAHAFWILLQPREDFDINVPPLDNNTDPNNPWKLTDKYTQFLSDGSNRTYVQQPDNNTNMFSDYRTSLLSMYLYMSGDSNALPNWEYRTNPQLTILMVLFSFLIAVYLMNLLIGLLSNAIEEDNNRVSYLVQKAKILAEIELFYLFPYQRRWKTWFPDVIYYHANVEETRREIKKLINYKDFNTDKFSDLKKNLLSKIKLNYVMENLQDVINIEEEFKKA
ncbi:9371_t:CDS:2, partial [Funneliformis geosporum]